jgi:diguanylate cyclase (GGDEF)-like protein/PAS domain S-box-containing protein
MTELVGSILLVDDEQLNRDMLSRRLLRCGFSVALAASGHEALAMAHAQPFDLVLLDQMMPEISGTEVLRILRKTFSAEALPIVMVTAVAESEKVAEAIENGANDYITKPIDFKIALARIKSQLARKHAEDALRQSEERYALAAKASRDGLWDWNLVTGEVYYSPRWKQMLSLEEEEVASNPQSWFSRILAPDREAILAAVKLHIGGHSDWLQCAYRMLDARGSVRWMSCRGIATRNEQGTPLRLAGSQSDMTEEKTQDPLTGLPNRLRLLGDLECILDRSSDPDRAIASPAVICISLDGFKQINDSLGHVAGDLLLKGIAERLKRIAAQQDGEQEQTQDQNNGTSRAVAARMGGGEFAILIKGGATAQSVEALALLVQSSMKLPIDLSSHVVHCAFSIGTALASSLHSGPQDLLHDADVALSTAKRHGRGEIAAYATEMRDAAMQQLDLANDLRVAVERNELEVAYQPKVNLISGLTYGVEALVRWNHPTRGLLQPGSFISIAEETGAIVEIGSWIRRTSMAQVRAWHDLFSMQPPLELSVNLSPREFKQENLVEEIGRTLVTTKFPPSCLHLEITEDVLLEDMSAARFTLHALKKLGISLDIDDFGSGYSSLKYLQELPFDLLKVDRYFTQTLDPDKPSTGGLIQSIVSMARDLGLKVVAEGVETGAHSLKLQELGCSLGQGYYFSKPISPQAMQSFLEVERPAMPSTYAVPAADTSRGVAAAPGAPC